MRPQILNQLHRRWHPNGFFVRNTLSLLASFFMFCWICAATGKLLHTYAVTHFDWINLSLAYIWAPLSIFSLTWIALFHWELTYVTRFLPRPAGISLLIGCQLLCGWLGWLTLPSYTPFPPFVSIPFAAIGACVDCYLLAAFLCLGRDYLQGPCSFRFEEVRIDEGWKMFFHPSPFLRWYYTFLYEWHSLRQMVREDAKRGRPMNEQEVLQERIRRQAMLEVRAQQLRK